MIKRMTVFFLSFIFLLFSFAVPAFAEDCFSREQKDYYKNLGLQGTVINVYNWGEYISDGSDGLMDALSEFEKLTGAEVNYTNYESNENMYSKLIGGGVSYDVIVPSDYMVERLIDEKLLEQIDYGNIPNFDKYVREDCKNLFFDPEQKYSVCFNTGTTILIYNKKLVNEKPDSWRVLWDEQYKDKVLMFNNARDAFAVAQLTLGQDLNTDREQNWVDAANLLAEQRDRVNPVYVMDEVFNLMESGEYAFATYYAGDYVLMKENNDDLGYCFPKEGVNDFYDAFCIPTCCKNKKGAEAFINFMLEPEVSFDNEEFIYYASSNKDVMLNEESSLYGNEVVYPKEKLKAQYFRNLPQNILELENNLWSQVKSGSLSTNGAQDKKKIYTEFAAVVAFAAVVLLAAFINKQRKKKEQDLSDIYEQ